MALPILLELVLSAWQRGSLQHCDIDGNISEIMVKNDNNVSIFGISFTVVY